MVLIKICICFQFGDCKMTKVRTDPEHDRRDRERTKTDGGNSLLFCSASISILIKLKRRKHPIHNIIQEILDDIL